MSFFTVIVAKPRLVSCWVCEESFQTQRRRGERMSFFTVIAAPMSRVWLRAGFVKRVPNPAKKGREYV